MFLSDNTAPACPEIFAFLQQHIQGTTDLPYGDDFYTQQLNEFLSVIFDTDVWVMPVLTGTAANCLALGQLCNNYQSIICHESSHLAISESTAPVFFTGGARLQYCGGEIDKITPQQLAQQLEATHWNDIHGSPPATLAITQATELGRTYSPEDMQIFGDLCKQYGLNYFVDGARFANAVAARQCHPAELSWRAGVTAMTLGASKNGAFNVEALVIFDPQYAKGIMARAKRSGHLASKMRFLSAQLHTYFSNDLWLNNARHANQMAALCDRLLKQHSIETRFSAHTNQLFIRLTESQYHSSRDAGYEMYHWPLEDQGILKDYYRLVTHWSTSAEQIAGFADAIGIKVTKPI
ncbi:threonine aldolase family protein [Aliamphritea hakodatensis]|uniref:threonine aldolase family protein n=1 Tax=Aliamphritea hakodatensis TaxID=2895352 RepID=UPI0022FD6849|nr:beta-eliminating lyase-related protein [Aliamphritea hakodatensis]